jgi:AP-1 complex subunit beta-1
VERRKMQSRRSLQVSKSSIKPRPKNIIHQLISPSLAHFDCHSLSAAMTVGKDVSSLFPDVVNCMQTEDMELKKLVYLYLINYAKTQPDLAIMAVNTFVKDSQDPNPLIRALAVRTMGCIRVDRITEYLCDPLQKCLKDEDPYVRKTAAVCVAKLHDINPEMVEDRGFLDTLRNLIGDANPMVVANAVAALSEIQDVSGRPVFALDQASLTKLLRALNECTEWGQVFILDAVSAYEPADAAEAETVIERVLPRLQHANAAVVLSAVKVVLKNVARLEDPASAAAVGKKLAPPLVTLLGAEPEIQYVALRCINLVVQRAPEVLSHEVRVFFCKYNDPIYVKVEKLEIMVRLANENNVDQVLLEFKEYATEVDVDFVRRSVRAIGRCAVAIEAAAERCVNVLLDLIKTRVNYVVQEAVVVIKDIFRRYPNRYESVIATLCDCLDGLDEPEARASMVWIVGEYAERIDNADELLEQFLESFPEEPAMVQLQLVTAAVKLFLKKPTERPQALIQLVLTYATQETDNPDLRDRAYIYWRLLSTDPEAAKDVVLAEKPVITDARENLDPALLEELLGELGALSSVYHRPSGTFVSKTRMAVQRAEDLEKARAAAAAASAAGAGAGGDAGSVGLSSTLEQQLAGDGNSTQPGTPVGSSAAATPQAAVAAAPVPDLLGDLLDFDMDSSGGAPAVVAAPAAAGGVVDLLGDLDLGTTATAAQASQASPRPTATSTLPVLVDATKGKGLVIRGAVTRTPNPSSNITYQMEFENISAGVTLDGFMIQFNKNIFGFAPTNQVVAVAPIAPGATCAVSVPLTQTASLVAPPAAGSNAPGTLQVAIKSNQLGVLYLVDTVTAAPALSESGKIDSAAFVSGWKAIPEDQEVQQQLQNVVITDVEAATAKLESKNIFVMAHKIVGEEQVLYCTGKVEIPGAPVQALVELRFSTTGGAVRAYYRSTRQDLAQVVLAAVSAALV